MVDNVLLHEDTSVGGPAQNMPNFQVAEMTQKHGQTNSTYSLDGVGRVLIKK